MIKTNLVDGTGTGNRARVTAFGQVITGPVSYNSVATQDMDVATQVYNFVIPQAGHRIVIDGLLLYANRNVGVNDATVTIYESTGGPDSAVVSQTILNTEMAKQTRADIIGINFLCSEGSWINASTDDDDVFLTVLYYYVPITDFT